MSSVERFDQDNTKIQAAASKATQLAAGLPSDEDVAFYRSMHPVYSQKLDQLSAKLLSKINKIFETATVVTSATSKKGKEKEKLVHEDVTEHFRSAVVSRMDDFFETADYALDKHLGKIRAPAIAVNAPIHRGKKSLNKKKDNAYLTPDIYRTSTTVRPQSRFKQPPENFETKQWHPTLQSKVNAQVPLPDYSQYESSSSSTPLPHPYLYEITNISYPSSMFDRPTPTPPRSFQDTPYTWIDTPELLSELIVKLKQAKEIAVDLEHHDLRSWTGFVCLMQISTRTEDFIIDTLSLREELEVLNHVFTDPTIVKIFHGAEQDVIWLQRDFNLYLVNLFDTYHAAVALSFERRSLAYMLDKYCDFQADKKYQRADWRIRPLTDEMLHYARADTHFLLFIYDKLRVDLADKSTKANAGPETELRNVLANSAQTALHVHAIEPYDVTGSNPIGWNNLARSWNRPMWSKDAPENTERSVFRDLQFWREKLSREEDESLYFILSNANLIKIMDRRPQDELSLLELLGDWATQLIRNRTQDILSIIKPLQKSAPVPFYKKKGGQQSPLTPLLNGDRSSYNEQLVTTRATSVMNHSQQDKLWHAGDSLYLYKPSVGFNPRSAPNLVAPSSTLFGQSIQASVPRVIPKSTLFSGFTSAEPGSSSVFSKVADRIHQGLAVNATPLVTDLEPAQPALSPQAGVQMEGPAEIPYIASSQRNAPEESRDEIVVVGQRKSKKAKRVPKTPAVESAVPSKQKRKAPEETVEPFDFTSAGNILDSNVEAPSTQPAKKRKFKSGDFPAPPKARAEVKSGNKSKTFK